MLRLSFATLRHPAGLASLAACMLLLAALAAWTRFLLAPLPGAPAHAAAPAAIDASAGATLFGSRPEHGGHDAVQLLGILAFDPHHAAAIVSVGGEAARVVRLNGTVTDSTTLSEVRAHSIVVDHNGVTREITQPAAVNPSVFVR